ncbi:splicing factor [Loa loa]|uniref:Splicing factor n=1 Tax=Loa loa TaxID=7209 RepID=A0A1I7VE17_LOALO|nr:splicing factor [Loa loa]EFO25018.1 splicing factor [Loa loa]
MVKSPKHRSSSNKKSPSKNSQSKDSSLARTQSRKTSRSRSRSRSTHGTPRSRSSSRGRRSSSKKKTVSPVVKRLDDSVADIKKVIPLYRSSKNDSSYKIFPFSDKGVRRRPLTVSLLKPINVNNLKVKGIKFKQHIFVHCKRFSRYYVILSMLGLIAVGIFYTGYTVDQMAKYVREPIDIMTAYVQRRA